MSFTRKDRGYVTGRFALDLDGMAGGWLFSVEGGMGQAEVVTEKLGPDSLFHKHLSTVKYDDITLTCGLAMSREFFRWIGQSFQGNYERKSGAVISADYDYKEILRLNFHEGLVTEVGFPALDASSREQARLTVKISPEYTRLEPPGNKGASIAGKYPIDPLRSKHWLARNFRCEVKGLDCSRVSKVEAITIKQKVTEVPLGEFRDAYREPGAVEYPNVVFTLPESHAADWFRWYQSFVLDGKCSEKEERDGSIEFLHEDMKTVSCRIDLNHLGLFKLSLDKAEAGADKIRNVRAEMYCQSMKFTINEAFV